MEFQSHCNCSRELFQKLGEVAVNNTVRHHKYLADNCGGAWAFSMNSVASKDSPLSYLFVEQKFGAKCKISISPRLFP